MQHFGISLIKWYSLNKRKLPWRETNDPYKIWLSEIILQQTRVNQGLSYYMNFAERFPDIKQLSLADGDEVYKMWQGLGYYNRADNMLHTAKTIVKKYNGRFPADYNELQKLKGIGSYTAAAIASFAFDIPKPVVDGNVFRVLSRLFAIKTPINSTSGKKDFEKFALKLMSNHPPSEFNQAIMEFGATHCRPKNPDCHLCILSKDCVANRMNQVNSYPVKLKKQQVKKRFFYYALVEINNNNGSSFLLHKRDKKDIWKNLYDFPMVEFAQLANPIDALPELTKMLKFETGNIHIEHISENYQHQLTHQQINAVFLRLKVNGIKKFETENSILLVHQNDIIKYPVSRLIEKYLQDQKLID